MSYIGLRTSHDNKHFARYRIKGEIIEVGPYDTLAELLKANMGRKSPPASAGDTRDQSCVQAQLVQTTPVCHNSEV